MTKSLLSTYRTRIYYEDTDLGGVVYHSRYLNFAERARSEWLLSAGIAQTKLLEDNIAFVVKHLTIDYQKPARFEDEIRVETSLATMGKARFHLCQEIWREDVLLARLDVTLALINLLKGRPLPLPDWLKQAITKA